MDLIVTFCETYGSTPRLTCRAPGQVNLLGEPGADDQGVVLQAAIDRHVHLAVSPREDRFVHLYSCDTLLQTAFRLDQLEARHDLHNQPLSGWALLLAGVAWSLSVAGYPLCGLNAMLSSDIPAGAGLGSSQAMEAGLAMIWSVLGGWQIDPMLLARLCERAETEYAGTDGSLADLLASLSGVEGHALYFDARNLDWRPLQLPRQTVLIIADTGLRCIQSGLAHKERRAACEQAVYALRQYLPALRSLRDVSPQEFAAYSEYLTSDARQRAEHVVKETARVQSGVNALQRKEPRSFGALMNSSHTSLRDLYQVSTPELDVLVDIARNIPGCLGARLTGAGFGGCTVNLVEEDQGEQFVQELTVGYLQRTGRESSIVACRAAQGVTVEQLG